MKNGLALTITAFAAIVLGLSMSAFAQPDGRYGMGRGMMGGYGPGYGMGPGMMDGYGPGYGMGPGMGGWNSYGGLDLTADQRAKISRIQHDLRTKHWALMGKMMDARYRLQELYDAEKPDSAAINQQYKEMEDLRRQMVDLSIEARNQINAILTNEQRQKLSARDREGPMMWGW